MQTVILAGGFGSRLADVLDPALPKSMAPLLGVPLQEHLLIQLRSQNIVDILLLVHHRAEAIRNHFGDGNNFSVNINYIEETSPRGTAGALVDALLYLKDEFFVITETLLLILTSGECWLSTRIIVPSSLYLHTPTTIRTTPIFLRLTAIGV